MRPSTLRPARATLRSVVRVPAFSALVLTLAAFSTNNGPCTPGATVTDFKTDGSIGARWNAATQTLAYGRLGPDGHYWAYLSDANGNNEVRLTNAAWPDNRHQFVPVWHPSGKYLFVEVEKTNHPGTSDDAIPGYGAYTDLWLVTRDGAQAWKLIDLPNDYDHALTHAAITPDGSRFTWTERVKAPNVLDLNQAAGSYVFNFADFVDGPTPRLANIVPVKPGNVDQGGEVDGISADGSTLAFYSTYVTKNLCASRIYTLNLNTQAITQLTTDSFAQAPQFTGDGKSLVYMSGSKADLFAGEVQGADWWMVGIDGTNRQRLTCMNSLNNPQSVNYYRLAGSFAFLSPRMFFGDVLLKPLGLVGKIVTVTINPP